MKRLFVVLFWNDARVRKCLYTRLYRYALKITTSPSEYSQESNFERTLFSLEKIIYVLGFGREEKDIFVVEIFVEKPRDSSS